MTDRPMIFSSPMILALLAGRKTMTRRISKKQDWPAAIIKRFPNQQYDKHPCQVGDRIWVRETWQIVNLDKNTQLCAYRANTDGNRFTYAGDGSVEIIQIKKWRSPIFMPRVASRLTLLVESVKIERLNDISEEDAIAEGIEEETLSESPLSQFRKRFLLKSFHGEICRGMTAVDAFGTLWELLHGEGSWSDNPFVCVIGFSVVHENFDAIGADQKEIL